ncbi:mitochondrial ubiquitin ligase activator of nfkb 1-A [Halichoeres trimaculatus]|uniref:mitochondrial ubiquitin ligase activator of nfkb 1-A n=1 Tax=Halichoeres trimaculatus TaxID=147232 RepID=UPI003D9E8F88
MDGFNLYISEALCLGASLGLSVICYHAYRKSRRALDKLDDAPHFDIDNKLRDILKVTPGACLQYAVIEGAVQPVGEPLTSHFQKDIAGVLQKFCLKEHRLVWNSISRTWTDSEKLLHERMNSVPFMLVGSDQTTIKVLCPLQASGDHMETTYEKFHQVKYGLGDIVGQYLSGQKIKGQLETEEMLKVGATLTGVGEVVLDTDGILNLRPPANGSLYILSTSDFDTLRGNQESTAVLWKSLGITSVLVGAAVLLWVGWRYYKKLKNRWEREQERRQFERLRAQTPPQAQRTGTGQDEEEHTGNTCVICLTQPRNCILLNCGHVCCCYSCYQMLPHRKCPMCRQRISRVVPLYHA